MKASLNWLKEYVDINLLPEKLATELTLRSVEVNSIEKTNAGLDKVIVGKILKVAKHPNADKLHLVYVDIGKKKLEIVCGGSNITEQSIGWKVPVALVGCQLPSGIKIEKANIRGIVSFGMLCSAEELGLPKKGEREIMVLDNKYQAGEKLIKYLNLQDIVFDLDILSNRADLMGHVGLAREIAAITGKKLKLRKVDLSSDKDFPVEQKAKKHLQVLVKDAKICPRYSALIISGIKIESSPAWLKNRLAAVGIRSINNIVDLTNYIMMNDSQPLHAFDYDKIIGKTMIVREARAGEKVKTLDGKIWQLHKGMPVIQDSKRLIDLAGIMGGAASEVSDQTKTIILQAAVFDPLTIRKTSRILGQRTEAEARYEKSVDLSCTMLVLAYAYSLLKKILPSANLVDIIDIGKKFLPIKKINLSLSSIEKLIGIKIPEKEIFHILEILEIKIVKKNKDVLIVAIPSFRPDLTIPEDIIEEIARIYGYNKIPETVPSGNLIPPQVPSGFDLIKQTKRFLQAQGFQEVYNYSFQSQNLFQKLGLVSKDHIEIANPLSAEQQYLRTEHLSSLLENLSSNLANSEKISLFELAEVYFPLINKQPPELNLLTGVITEEGDNQNSAFRKAKGFLSELFSLFNINVDTDLLSKEELKNSIFRVPITPRKSLKFTSKGKLIAILSCLPNDLSLKFDINQPVVFFVVALDLLVKVREEEKNFQAIPRFPGAKLDVAFTVNQKVLYSDIVKTIKQAGGQLLAGIELFDIYTGKQIAANQQSLAFHLVYRDPNKTLILTEAQRVHDAIIKKLENIYQAKIRLK